MHRTDIIEEDDQVEADSLCEVFLGPGHAANQRRVYTRSLLKAMDALRTDLVSGNIASSHTSQLRLSCLWYALGAHLLRHPSTLVYVSSPRFSVKSGFVHSCWKLECLSVIHSACLCVERYCAYTFYAQRLCPTIIIGGGLKPVLECPLQMARLCVSLLYWARYNLVPVCRALAPGLESVAAVESDDLIDRLRCDVYIMAALTLAHPEGQTNNVMIMRTLRPLANKSARACMVFTCFLVRYHRYRRETQDELAVLSRLPGIMRTFCGEWKQSCEPENAQSVDAWLRVQELECEGLATILKNSRGGDVASPGSALVKTHDFPHYMGHDVFQYTDCKGDAVTRNLTLDLNDLEWPVFELWTHQ